MAQLPSQMDEFYGLDDFKSVYYGVDDTLFKKNTNSTYQFFDLQLGTIESVHLINPLKILVFYRETQTIVLLDNRLNEQLRINLSNLAPARFISHVQLAGEQRIWIFNTDLNRLELINYNTGDLIMSTPPAENEVLDLIADFNFAHIITNDGIISYNGYASAVARLKLDDILAAQLDYRNLLLATKQGWAYYQFTNDNRWVESTSSIQNLRERPSKSFYLKEGKLYLYRSVKNQIITIKQ